MTGRACRSWSTEPIADDHLGETRKCGAHVAGSKGRVEFGDHVAHELSSTKIAGRRLFKRFSMTMLCISVSLTRPQQGFLLCLDASQALPTTKA